MDSQMGKDRLSMNIQVPSLGRSIQAELDATTMTSNMALAEYLGQVSSTGSKNHPKEFAQGVQNRLCAHWHLRSARPSRLPHSKTPTNQSCGTRRTSSNTACTRRCTAYVIEHHCILIAPCIQRSLRPVLGGLLFCSESSRTSVLPRMPKSGISNKERQGSQTRPANLEYLKFPYLLNRDLSEYHRMLRQESGRGPVSGRASLQNPRLV